MLIKISIPVVNRKSRLAVSAMAIICSHSLSYKSEYTERKLKYGFSHREAVLEVNRLIANQALGKLHFVAKAYPTIVSLNTQRRGFDLEGRRRERERQVSRQGQEIRHFG